MRVPSHTLRIVFGLSALACSVIVVLFMRGRVSFVDENRFWLEVGASALALTSVACGLAFRRGGLRLEGVSLGDLVFSFLRSLLVAYVGSASVITLVGFALLYTQTHTVSHALALAGLAGLWLSAWFAPGVAAVMSWRRLRSTASVG